MKLTRLSDIRRRELRQAALRVLQKEGAAATTLDKVAVEAGASKGILLHYFDSKVELFEQAMREGNLALRDRVAYRMKHAKTPFQRLWVIVEENLDENSYRHENAHAWLSLCAEAPREPRLSRIQTVIHRRMQSNLMSALTQMLPRQDAETFTYTLTALIDGLWLRLGIGDPTISSKTALKMAHELMRLSLPVHYVEEVRS